MLNSGQIFMILNSNVFSLQQNKGIRLPVQTHLEDTLAVSLVLFGISNNVSQDMIRWYWTFPHLHGIWEDSFCWNSETHYDLNYFCNTVYHASGRHNKPLSFWPTCAGTCAAWSHWPFWVRLHLEACQFEEIMSWVIVFFHVLFVRRALMN